MSEWISVKDRLPENEGNYLTVCRNRRNGNKRIAISYYDPSYRWEIAIDYWSGIDVTHWMPLPELPEKEAESSAE